MVSKWIISPILINRVYWGYDPLTLILTSWDIQVLQKPTGTLFVLDQVPFCSASLFGSLMYPHVFHEDMVLKDLSHRIHV